MRLHQHLVSAVHRPYLPRRTLRLRLTLLYGSLFLISGAGLLAITYVFVSKATDSACLSRGNGTTVCGFSSGSAVPRGQPRGVQASGSVVTRVGTGIPRVLAGPKGLTPKQLQAQAHQIQVLAAQQHATELHQLLIRSGLALGIMGLFSIVLGWLVAGRVLRPLRTITAAARDISATNLHRRLALAGPDDELKELGDTFDGLLTRLEASFQSQRQIVANASHELRTPLARQRALAQVALSDPDATVESLRLAHERVLNSGSNRSSSSRPCSPFRGCRGARGDGAVRPGGHYAGGAHLTDGRSGPPRAPGQRGVRCGPDGGGPPTGRAAGRQPAGQRAASQRPRGRR